MSASIALIDERLTDEELVERIRNGSRECLDVLVEAYLPKVYNKVQGLVPESDAEDVTQEIFLSLINSIGNFQGKSTFATWFHRITMNRVADYYRKISRRQKQESNREPDPSVLDPWEWMDSELALKEALVSLPDKYKEVLLLRFLEGLSLKDIAERLGLTYGTARYRYRRAIRIVRRKICS